MPFVDDLERELHRAARTREARPRARRRPSPAFALAPAAALAAVVAAVVLSTPEKEEAVRVEPRPASNALTGSHVTTVREGKWKGDWELFVRGRNARLLGTMDGAAVSFSAGATSFRGDEVTFRVDLAHTGSDPWPEPICARQRRDTPGTYRFVRRSDGSFTLRALSDPCRGRATILGAGRWRRTG